MYFPKKVCIFSLAFIKFYLFFVMVIPMSFCSLDAFFLVFVNFFPVSLYYLKAVFPLYGLHDNLELYKLAKDFIIFILE